MWSIQRKPWWLLSLLPAALLLLTGCSGSNNVSQNDEAKLKKEFSKTGFDINDVPEKDRERVKSLMQQYGSKPPGK
jgi:uncharacterized protein YcfL